MKRDVMKRCVLLAAVAIAAAAPWIHDAGGSDAGGSDAVGSHGTVVAASSEFPGWPTALDGAALRELPLSLQQQRFTEDFPGRVGRFHDGQREVIVRWLDRPSRRLHPASHCYLGHGYEVEPQPIWQDDKGQIWSSFIATRDGHRWRVREAIFDDAGGQWPDVSAWYWAAWRHGSVGPWWSYIVAEPLPAD